MLAETSLIAAKWKIFASCSVAVISLLADAGATPGSYEDLGLKTILVVAIVFTVRLLLKQQEEHKADRAKDAAAHLADAKAREDKMIAAMEKQSDTMERVADLTQRQTDHFESVMKNVLEERLKNKPIP